MTKPTLPILQRGHPLAQGLIGAWLMHDKSGGTVTDVSGRKNHGTLTNMDPTTDWVSNREGSALAFDGSDDYVAITNDNGYDFSAYTAVWTGAYVTSEAWGGLYAVTTNGTDAKVTLQRYSTNNVFRVYHSNTNFIALTNLWPSSLTSGFNQLAITWNANTLKSFLNAEQRDSLSFTTAPGSGIGDMFLGCERGTTANTQADVSSFLLYNRALSAEEIAALYLNPYVAFRPALRVFPIISAPATTVPVFMHHYNTLRSAS